MTTETKPLPDAADLTGYSTEDTFLATRFQQGGRTIYGIDLSIPQIVGTLARPDPTKKLLGNRQINVPHARSFAMYVRRRINGVMPPLMLRAPEGVFTFDVLRVVGGTEWGILHIPRLAKNDIAIIDGQHRILGFHIALEELQADLQVARGRVADAKKLGDDALVKQHQSKVTALEDERRRLAEERIAAEIVLVDSPDEYKQVFVDIADNALGITKTVRALFDSTKIVHRCLDEVMQHPLLLGRVDFDHDRVLGTNPNFMGAKHVADLIRTIVVGINGRVSRRMEDELKEDELVARANVCLDVLVLAFPDLKAVADGAMLPAQLRASSLLGSVTMQRVLAGVFFELAESNKWNRLQIQRFFELLAPHMGAPVGEDSPWVTQTNQFVKGALAPSARAQELTELTTLITSWAIATPEWLKK